MSSLNNAINILRSDLDKAKRVEEIPDGTIIKFTRKKHYRYVVIKEGDRFYSTASSSKGFVPPSMNYDELIAILTDPQVTDVAVAIEFQPL